MLPEEAIVKILNEKNMHIATAESCTGGLVAKKITDISGSSGMYELGVVSYANRIKHKILNVEENTLATVGAVSKETCEQMAKGVCLLADADIGISTTGIAGPTGGTPTKPVGLVYIGIYLKKTDKTEVHELRLSGSRDEVRNQTANILLSRVVEIISENNF